MKIKSKLTTAFLAIALLPLLLLGSIFYGAEKKVLTQQISQQLISIASLQRARLASIVEQNQERLSLVTSRTQLRTSLDKYLRDGKKEDQERMVRILKDAQASIKSFKKISIFGLDRKIMASTAAGPWDENVYFDEELFVRGQGVNCADTFFLNGKNELKLLLAGPLWLDNVLLGVMLIESDPENIISTVRSYSGLGETGEIILVAQNSAGDSVSLTPTRFNKGAALRLVLEFEACDYLFNQGFVQKGEFTAEGVLDYRKQPVIMVGQFVEAANWVVLVKIDQAEANVPINTLRNFLIGAVVGLFALICIVSLYIAGSITRPIIRLTDAAQNIAKGIFTHCTVETSENEIGTLARTFNGMTDSLQSARTELETKLQELHAEILERHKAEDALRGSEEKYRTIYNAPGEGIFLHDAVTAAIVDVNRAGLEMFGYSYGEMLEQDLVSLSAGESPHTMEYAVQKLEKTVAQGAQLFEWQVKNKKGDHFWVEVGLRYTEFGGQKYVIAVVRDISERKEAAEALAAEKERLAVTLRSIGDGVITTDMNGNIVLINKIAEKLTGWSYEEAAGKPLTEVFHILNSNTRQPCENPASKVLESGMIIGLTSHTILVARDGSECSIADSGAPIRDTKNDIVGVVLVFRDVTEENKRDEELAKARKLESVGQLAGGIAHDFNNLLAAILGNINLALLFVKPGDEAYPLLQDAEKASSRATALTRQLLTFAKGGEPVKELAAIKDIIVDSARFVLRGSNVRCDFHFDDDLWPVEIDQGQMSQVIQNIVINADQAMPEGGVIEVRCSNLSGQEGPGPDLGPGDYIKIAIKDSGVGIPSSLLDKIFDPYFTTKQKGSGLGLAVSHSIISKHDGYMKVSSEPGVGTNFTLYLPAVKDKLLVLGDQEEVVEELDGQGKIMIMDDEALVRKVAGGMLAHFGYEVFLAKDGEEAIALFKEARQSAAPIDLIIMDLTIPGAMGGQEAVQEIHKIDPEAKVIVSSGYSNDPIMANYQEYGFLAAIVKPFQLHELKKVLRRVL